MLSVEMSIFVIALSLLLLFMLFLYRFFSSNYYHSKSHTKVRRFRGRHYIGELFNRLIVISTLTEYIGRRLSEYRGQISELNKKRAISTAVAIILIDLLMTAVFMLFDNSMTIRIIFCISIVFVDKKIVDFIVYRSKTDFLSSMVDFLDIYRNKYFESGNIPDEALILSLQSLDDKRYEAFILEIERIYELVTSPDADVLITEYYQLSKNNYLKLFAGLIHLTMENGDVMTRDGLAFSNSLNWLSLEIKDEILMRDKLSFSLKSLNFIAVIPVYLLTPIKNWASKNFYPLEKFYTSSLGFKTELFVAIIMLLSYILLSSIEDYSFERESIIVRLFHPRKKSVFARLLTYVKPIPNSFRYKRIANLREEALLDESIEVIYLKKIAYMMLFFVLAVVITVSSMELKKHAVLYNPTAPDGYLGGELVGEELKDAMIRSEKDRRIMKAIESGLSKDEILDMIDEEYQVFREDRNRVVKRIINKYNTYTSAQIGFLDVFMIYMFTLLGFVFYNFVLRFKKRLVKIDSFGEIVKYQLIILVLMQSSTTKIDDILIWMERFSKVYKEPINRAIMDYDSGSEEALVKLKNESKNDEFKKIVEHMIGAENNISIKEAFSELESEKKYYEEKRKVVYNRIINRKIGVGKIVGFVPMYALIVVYFMFPLVYVSVTEIQVYFDVLI